MQPRFLSFLFAITFLLAIFACNKENELQPKDIPVTGITLNASNATLVVNERLQLVATVSPSNASNKGIIWSTSNASIASVENGLVTAIAEGSVFITAKTDDGGFKEQCTVTIKNSEKAITQEPLNVSYISAQIPGMFSVSDMTSVLSAGIIVSEVESVIPSSSVEYAADKILADNSFLIDLEGLVSGKKYFYRSFLKLKSDTLFGDVKSFSTKSVADMVKTLAATPIETGGAIMNGMVSDAALAHEVEKVGFIVGASKEYMTGNYVGEFLYDEPDSLRFNYELKDYSNYDVLYCFAYIVFKGKRYDGEIASFSPIGLPVQGIGVSPETLTLCPGETAYIYPSFTPSQCKNQNISAHSVNEYIASVSTDGARATVCGNNLGKTTITLTSEDGGFTANCEVTVCGISTCEEVIKGEIGCKYYVEGVYSKITDNYINYNYLEDSTGKLFIGLYSSNYDILAVGDTIKVSGTKSMYQGEPELSNVKILSIKNTEAVPLSGVSIPASICISSGCTVLLEPTFYPSRAQNKNVRWTSDNSSIASVDGNGNVTAKSIGKTKITVTTDEGDYKSECTFTVCDPNEALDLGLSVKWAQCNLGASSPSGIGGYYAWGETSTKSTYSWEIYKWSDSKGSQYLKYNTDSSYGTVDNKTVLDPEDDAAAVILGNGWRMPTVEEIKELINNSDKIKLTVNNVSGYYYRSRRNDKGIFVPFSGYKRDQTIVQQGNAFFFSSTLNSTFPVTSYYLNGGLTSRRTRSDGVPIRAVK